MPLEHRVNMQSALIQGGVDAQIHVHASTIMPNKHLIVYNELMESASTKRMRVSLFEYHEASCLTVAQRHHRRHEDSFKA